jgi:3-oxoadipate enol-lactonase
MSNQLVSDQCYVSGHGEPVVLVHGNASTHETWAGVVGHLEQDFRCISYDLRGHGPRSGDDGPYSLDDLVDDLENLRARLELESAHVVGHSLGGMIAAAYARRYPNRVMTLCLMATPAGRTAEDKAKAITFSELIRKNGVRATLGTMVDSWYTDDFVASNPGALETRLEQIVRIKTDTFLNDLELYSETAIESWLDELHIPTLVMTGEFATGSGPHMSQIIHDALPDSELMIFDGLKNGILTEIPDRVANEVSTFIRSRRPQT